MSRRQIEPYQFAMRLFIQGIDANYLVRELDCGAKIARALALSRQFT